MTRRLQAAAMGLLCSGLVACQGGSNSAVSSSPVTARADAGQAQVVVAVIDSGINVYHDFFHAGSDIYSKSAPSAVTPQVLEAFDIGPEQTISLSRSGDFFADFAQDAQIWNNIRPFQFYWFEGTNIIATTHQIADLAAGNIPILPDTESDTHGVGTSAAVLTANPEAIVLFIEPDGLGSVDSHELAFTHPAVDMISSSYGVSIPGVALPIPETANFEFSYTGMVDLGKMHFSSAGNAPGFSPFRAGAGPWWSIGVSGIEEGTSEGRTTLSGIFPDFVSDFVQDLPYCQACEEGSSSVGGTSFSTPRAAGVASKILLEARRKAGHVGGIKLIDGEAFMVAANDVFITNWQLRRAMEEAAWIPQIGDYDPIAGVLDLGALPVNPLAPWLQVGWGDLTADPDKAVVSEALAQLGFGEVTRVKEAGYCEHQTAWIEVRKAYWNNLAIGSESFGTSADPFEYCDGLLP